MQRSQRRSTKVCVRCRKRKTKCDFKFPACTTCKLANAVCLGFDPAARQPVPRSLVKSLEARVAELETRVLAVQAAPQNVPHSMASRIAEATISSGVPNSGSFLRSKVSSNLFFRPSCPPLAVVREQGRDSTEHHPMSSNKPRGVDRHNVHSSNTFIDLNSVPDSAIERMIENYAETHLPQYPCVTKPMLESILRNIQESRLGDDKSLAVHGISTASGVGHFEYFVFFIVLGISALTLTWKAEDQARAASESFYKSARNHLQALEDHSEIQALQISLLLAHYAHMCPERVDNWTCIANAVRIVLSLGLYKEGPEGLNEEQRQLRRDLFWVTYGMERSMSSNLRLPLSFAEEAISTKFDNSADDALSSLFIGDGVRKKSSATHIYLYRALETEVHRVLYLQEELQNFGSTEIESWIEGISGRLATWYEKAQSWTQYNMLEFKGVQFYHLRVRIHQPTPRLRTRTAEDRRIVLESSLALIEDYLGQERRRRLFYPWHGVHILFETVVVSLEACWCSRDSLVLGPQVKHMLESSIPQCVQMLANIGHRWNEAAACAERLRPLVEKVSSAIAEAREPLYFHYEDLAITEEIHGLLFSGGPLSWNQMVDGDWPINFEDGSQFLENAVVDSAEVFLWDPEWYIVPAVAQCEMDVG